MLPVLGVGVGVGVGVGPLFPPPPQAMNDETSNRTNIEYVLEKYERRLSKQSVTMDLHFGSKCQFEPSEKNVVFYAA